MTSLRHPSRLVALSLLSLVAACGDDPGAPPEPSGADAQVISADIAASSGVSIAGDLATWSGNEGAVAGGFGGANAPDAGTCTRSGNTVTCTGGREGTLTVQRTIGFFDAQGTAQPQYDAATTARITFGVLASGSMTGPDFSSTVERRRAHTASGLAGSETQRTWNGTGSATVQSTYSGPTVTRTHRLVENDTTTDVVWVVSPRREAYPASGTVVRHVAVNTTLSGERTGNLSTTRRVVVTFNGTAQVPMTVSAVRRGGALVELSCTLDLAARAVTCGSPAA